TATAGQDLELELTNINVSGGSQNQVGVTVTNAAGTSIANISCNGSTSSATYCHIPSLWNLAAGTYSITVTPATGGTMSFNALLQPDVIGPALTANAPTTVNLGVGQIERLTFTGTAGQTVALNVSAESTTPAGQGVYVFVYQPGTITPTNYYTYVFTNGSTNTLNLPNLPASGTYTLSVATPYGVPGTVQVTLVPQ
ncbi:glutamate synthase, partial [Rhodanobacter sp. C05]